MFIFVFSLQLVDRLAFPAIMLFFLYFRSCEVCNVLVYIDVCSDLVRNDACSILLPTMWSEIFLSLFLLDVLADGRVWFCPPSLHEFYRSNFYAIKNNYRCASLYVTAVAPIHWVSVSALLLKETYFLHLNNFFSNIKKRCCYSVKSTTL